MTKGAKLIERYREKKLVNRTTERHSSAAVLIREVGRNAKHDATPNTLASRGGRQKQLSKPYVQWLAN